MQMAGGPTHMAMMQHAIHTNAAVVQGHVRVAAAYPMAATQACASDHFAHPHTPLDPRA